MVAKRTRLHVTADRHDDPATIPFYSSKKAQLQVVSRGFNALKISDRQRFTLKAYGKPFNYQGVMTKRYDVPALEKLFFVSSRTIHSWVEKGLLQEPMLVLSYARKRLWFYHQVQPLYVWYWHIRSRRERMRDLPEADLKVLKRMQRFSDIRWHKLIGVEWHDPYREKAGKYGVIHC
jgi:hypothetical protein